MPKLKAAQQWILRNIVEKLLVHGSVHGFLPGRSTLTNAAAHADPHIVVKMDIKDFFPTVTLPRVKGVFRKAGYREQVATLLALICTESPREIVRARGQELLRRPGPALPAARGADEPGPDQHAGPPPRPPADAGWRRSWAGATPATPTT